MHEQLARQSGPSTLEELRGRLFESLPLMITVYDLRLGVVEVNTEFTRVLGWTNDEIRKCNLMELCYPNEVERAQAARFMAEPGRGWQDFQVRAKDGSLVPSSWTSIHVSEDRRIGLGIDLRDQSQAENRLREVEARYSLVMEAGQLGAFDIDFTAGVIWWDSRARSIFGVPPDEAYDFPRALALSHPDDRARALDAFKQAIAPGSSGLYRIDKRVIRPDGKLIWVSVRGRAIRTDSSTGNPALHLIGTIQDITAHKQAQQELRRSALMLRSSRDAIIVRRLDGAVVLWNQGAEELYGYSPDQARGRLLHELLRTQSKLSFEDIQQAVQDQGQWEGELEQRSMSGERRVTSCRLQRIDDPEDDTVVLEIHRDISEQRAYHDALERADRQKNEFLAMLGHELRNPLAAIRTAVLLQENSSATEQVQERARQIVARQSKHMMRLVDDLLDVSRIISGKIELQRERINLVEVVGTSVEDQRDLIHARGLELRLAIPQAPCWVHGDPTRLAQAVSNLLSNAAKFTDAPGVVEVSLAEEAGCAVIRVRDSGVGVDAELLPLLFEPFRQGKQNLARTAGGLGLGLALVRGLVELHGGTAEASSPGPGQGSEFCLRLPIDAPVHDSDAAARAAHQDAPARILLVEDHEDSAEMLSMLLEHRGHEVVLATHGAEAIALARRTRPATVLCDIGLPGDLSGYDVAAALRADPTLHDTFLIALTGYARDEDRARAHVAGFDVHLSKPVDIAQLKALLERGRAAAREYVATMGEAAQD